MGFLDPFGVGDGVSVMSGGGGLSRPSARRRASSRARSHKKKRSRSRSSSRHRGRNGSSANLGAGLSSFFGTDDRHHKRSSSHHRGHGTSAAALGAGLSSFFGNDSHYHKHASSRASFFGLGEDRNRSRGSFFGFSKPSYYKRSSRHGFIHRTQKQIKRLFRDLVHWAKRHPWKVFFLVLMPLISGGVLTALLARFGLKIPAQLERLLGVASKAAVGDTGGLVGEAVRMAGNFSGSRDGPTSVRVHDRDTGYGWEKNYPRSGEAWGDTVTSMAKMFI